MKLKLDEKDVEIERLEKMVRDKKMNTHCEIEKLKQLLKDTEKRKNIEILKR